MSPPVILLLSGPNPALLAKRRPDVLGPSGLAERLARAEAAAERLGLGLEHLQSEHEGDLVLAVRRARGRAAAIVVDAGALRRYGWALHDELATFAGPVVELQPTSPDTRPPSRRGSVLAPVCDGTVAGFGAAGYELGVEAAARLLRSPAPAPARGRRS